MKYTLLSNDLIEVDTGIVVCNKNNKLIPVNQIKLMTVSEFLLSKYQARHSLTSNIVFSLPQENDSCIVESKNISYSFKIHCKLPAKSRNIINRNDFNYSKKELKIKSPNLLLSQNILLDSYYSTSQFTLNQLDISKKETIRKRPYAIGNVNPDYGTICFGPQLVKPVSLKEAHNTFWNAPFTSDYRVSPGAGRNITLKQVQNFAPTRNTTTWLEGVSNEYIYCNQHIDAVILISSDKLPEDVVKFESIFRNQSKLSTINFSFAFVKFIKEKNLWSVIIPAENGIGYGFTLKTLLTNPPVVTKKALVTKKVAGV